MKNSFVLVLALLGVASLASAYESELDDRERRLGWFKKKDYVGVYQRCCLQTDAVLASDESPCKCPKRTKTAAKWWFWTTNVKAKFEKSCGENGSLYRKGKVASFVNAPGGKGVSIADAVIARATAESDAASATAESDAEFTTLLALVLEAELAETLSGPGPFTVFAPTDAAFAAVGDLDTLKGLSNLKDILLCHVAAGNKPSSSLSDGDVDTVNPGKKVTISVSGGVKINGDATVTTADVLANNGVIHVINKVLDCEGGTFS